MMQTPTPHFSEPDPPPPKSEGPKPPTSLTVVEVLTTVLERTEAPDAIRVVLAILGATFGMMNDDSWQSARHGAQIPCGELGCQCHIQQAELMEIIEIERENFRFKHGVR